VNRFVHVLPPSVECHSGAFPLAQLPGGNVWLASSEPPPLTASDGSESDSVSRRVSVGSVLFTMVSTTK
jgi:hypothetical protein